MLKTKTLVFSILGLFLTSCGSSNSVSSTDAATLAQTNALQACYASSCFNLTDAAVKGMCNAVKETASSTTTSGVPSSSPACQNLMTTINLNCLAQSCNKNTANQAALTTALTTCIQTYETQNQAQVKAACES